MILRTGSADENVLDRSVRKCLGNRLRRQDGAGTASASATLRTRHIGLLAVTTAVNELAAQGIRPDSVRLEVLLPVGTEESVLREIIGEIRKTALQTGVSVPEVRTQVTSAVTRPVVTAQAAGSRHLFYGRAVMAREESGVPVSSGEYGPLSEDLLESAETCGQTRTVRPGPGDLILAVGQIGLEGTFLLAEERAQELECRFNRAFVRRAQQAGEQLSVLPALETMSESGLRPLHLVNVSDGSIYAALWRLSAQTGLGLTVSLPDIPILQETIEITNYYDINPYQMASSGCVLAVVSDDQTELRGWIEARGISGRCIGVLADGRDKVITNGEERQNLNRPAADVLTSLLG